MVDRARPSRRARARSLSKGSSSRLRATSRVAGVAVVSYSMSLMVWMLLMLEVSQKMGVVSMSRSGKAVSRSDWVGVCDRVRRLCGGGPVSVRELAARSGLGRRRIQRALGALVVGGDVVVRRSMVDGRVMVYERCWVSPIGPA